MKIAGLNVPSVALVGDDIHLGCEYQSEGGSRLYTLKWYKDNKEFYRHTPGMKSYNADSRCTQEEEFAVDGVKVACRASTETNVILESVSKATSGDYKCEVIGEHPNFRKDFRETRLTVFSEELQTPVITGNEDSYRAYDMVNLNCSSTNSEYNPDITWLVNGQKASEEHLQKYSDRQSVGLQFQASDDLFRHGVIEVTCTTSMGARHSMSHRVVLNNKDYLSAQGYYYNAGFPRSEFCLGCVLLSLLLSVGVFFPSM